VLEGGASGNNPSVWPDTYATANLGIRALRPARQDVKAGKMCSKPVGISNVSQLMKLTASIFWWRFGFRILVLALTTLPDGQARLEAQVAYTQPLSTGVSLDPVGDVVDLGSLPLGMVLAPDRKGLVVVLSGWREQGIQVVDLESRKVTQ